MANPKHDHPDPTSDSARTIFEYAQLGLALLDRSGRFLQANDAVGRLLDARASDLAGRNLLSIIDPVDASACQASLERAAGGSPEVGEWRLADSPRERWVRVELSPGPGDDATTPSIVATLLEVTSQHELASEVRTTTRRLQRLVDRANDIIFNIDLRGRFTWVNLTAGRLMKRSTDELIGMSFLELVHPAHRQEAERFYQRQVTERIPSTYYEFPAVAADGTEIWLGQYVQLILEGDRISNVQAVARNITARKQAEELLRASEERVRAVVSNAPIILWAADLDGVITLCEGHGLRGLHLEASEAVGRPVAEVYGAPEIADFVKRALEGEAFQAQTELGELTFDSWYAPLRDAAGQVTGVIGVAIDITEHVRLSARLRDAEKMEAIGRLAGGVAHDFNNQLTAVLGFAKMLEKSFSKDDSRAEDVRQILRGGRRAAALTEQLLAFGRKQPRSPTVLDLNAVVANLEPLLHSMREDVRLDLQLSPDACTVTADEVQVEQVVMNLALNSRDAMPAGGDLVIRTGIVRLGDVEVRDHPPLQPGRFVMVSVSDTGQGIDEETRAHLFEPFFTTKEQGKGTGMGLASAYGIIKQSGGFIDVTSELGQGSTFTFYLPVARRLETGDSPVPDGGSETILLVEDYSVVRGFTAAALGEAGYHVLLAESASEALITVPAKGELSLLLTDVVLPDGSGPELADRLAAIHPGLRVLFITAYAGDPGLRQRLDATHEVLEKPFGPKDLLGRVRRFLDNQPEPVTEAPRQ